MKETTQSTIVRKLSAHALTHAWMQSPRAWLSEGVAHFMGTVWIEKQRGREKALEALDSARPALTLAEPESPGVGTGQPLAQAIETLRELLAAAVRERHRPGVDFNARDNPAPGQRLGHRPAIPRPLAHRLVKKDRAADERAQPAGREQEVAIGPAIFLAGRDVVFRESLFNRRKAFIRRQDAFAEIRSIQTQLQHDRIDDGNGRC